MNDKLFIDTNVLVYYFDSDEPAKQARARTLLDSRTRARFVLSTQVLQEFYVSVTRKLAQPLPPSVAFDTVRDLMAMQIVPIDGPFILESIQLAQKTQLSLWDALVVQAALTAGCSRLLTEDLQDGQKIGSLEIENPFRGL